MSPSEQLCDTDRIEAYLNERLAAEHLLEFENHLTHCTACRALLQQRAADPQVWQDAQQLLVPDDSQDSWHASSLDGTPSKPVLSVLDALAPTDDPAMLGRIGEYEVSGVIGVGGMGAVLKGYDPSLRRVVAIKIMAPHLAGSGSARTRFHREARAAAAITHDNIIDIYGVAETNGLPYLVMPYARGPSLQKRIDQSGPMTPVEVARIGRQIAAGLAAAHEQGLVHRDIKPANILLNDGIERLWITDFGVARAVDDASMTQTGLIAGTPQFMSPEQARGETVDQRSDLFSLGSILYTACTGRAPFRSEAAYGILRRITDTDPRPIRDINPDVPEWLCRLIERLMAKHASDRFQTAEEVAGLLEVCVAHLQQPEQTELPRCLHQTHSPSQTHPALSPTRVGQPTTRFPLLSSTGARFMLAALLLLCSGLLAVQLTNPDDLNGNWSGELWPSVQLSSSVEADHWATGTFTNAAGEQGTLRLEWSRLQRRYHGRWQMEGQQSGSITLRADGTGQLRGAVAVDPEAKVDARTPRLREFVWRRGSRAVASPGPVTDSTQSSVRLAGGVHTLLSSVSGTITKVNQNLDPDLHVSRGDLLFEVEIALSSAEESTRKSEIEAARRQLEVDAVRVETAQRKLASMKSQLQSLTSQTKAYEEVVQQTTLGGESALASAKDALLSIKQEIEASQAILEQAQQQLEHGQRLYEQGVLPQTELQVLKTELAQARAQLATMQTKERAAANDITVRKSDQAIKEQQALIAAETAKSSVSKAEADLAQAQSDVADALAALESSESRLALLKQQHEKRSTFTVKAPIDGTLTELSPSLEGKTVQAGEVLCKIVADTNSSSGTTDSNSNPSDASSPVPSNAAPNSGSDASKATASAQANVRGAFPTRDWQPANTSISQTLSNASQLSERMRTAFADLNESQIQIESTRQALIDTEASLKRSQEKNDAVIVQHKQEHVKALKLQVRQAETAMASAEEALAAARIEAKVSRKLLDTQIQAAQRALESLLHRKEEAETSYAAGRLPLASLLQLEDEIIMAESQFNQLRVLDDYYEELLSY